MRKKLAFGIGLAVFLIAAAGCSQSVSPGQEFTLNVGKSIAVKGENMTINFVGVSSESRSPTGVQTIRAGEAIIQLDITRDGITSEVTVTEIGGTSGFTRTFWGRYAIDSQLLPYPDANDPQPKQSEYKLKLKITSINITGSSGPGPSGVPVVDNGAIVSGEVKSVASLSSRPVWAVEILVRSVQNLDNLPNMVAGKEGQTILVQTDQNVENLSAGQTITATVKLTGDERGSYYSASNIAP